MIRNFNGTYLRKRRILILLMNWKLEEKDMKLGAPHLILLVIMGSISSVHLEKRSMRDIISEAILTKAWSKNSSPLKKSYGSLEKFLHEVIPEDEMNNTDVRNFYDLFYLIPYQKHPAQNPPYDLNVLPVWIEDENFGDDIEIAIIGDGLCLEHPDLSNNYVIDNNIVKPANDHKSCPKIGTGIAGLIAMKIDGGACGIGVAPKAKVGGIQLIDGKATPTDFATILQHITTNTTVDIVLNIWDQEYSIEGNQLEEQAQANIHRAYEEGARKGRGGKGLVYIVPVGRRFLGDGDDNLRCAKKINVNSIHTIAVAATEHDGSESIMSAGCAAVMVTAYAASGCKDPNYKMSTTDVGGGCTDLDSLTEAAASLVAGILALALRANDGGRKMGIYFRSLEKSTTPPNDLIACSFDALTNRDLQHLIAWTSEVSPSEKNVYRFFFSNIWGKNAANFYINPFYGFGIINAYNLVKMAKNFRSVPPLSTCVQPSDIFDLGYRENTFTIETDGCRKTDNEINYIEHIQLEVSIKTIVDEDVHIDISSPQGTTVRILKYYSYKRREKGAKEVEMVDWIFDSVMFWGESPNGTWKITKFVSSRKNEFRVKLKKLILYIHGTKDAPKHYVGTFFGRKFRPYAGPTPSKAANLRWNLENDH